ncbi:uncharacterized protein B0I36DRAFT_350335 [Microdochium trichocladiopsis]|uniref:Uncharacterized protein n=1 Tax=Microdochium trichocladiopsis TaxID=1682393 RepID=A0A9P8Y2W4_9PEZI|nr:uncharacterized protein B0I36DRAFT_350335 [Microdochium trichocladiopsis]KAH7029459.1 hypothetical protein B0I36DRAFT_350335 [Microdochium trichocladiopsis]
MISSRVRRLKRQELRLDDRSSDLVTRDIYWHDQEWNISFCLYHNCSNLLLEASSAGRIKFKILIRLTSSASYDCCLSVRRYLAIAVLQLVVGMDDVPNTESSELIDNILEMGPSYSSTRSDEWGP